MKFQNRLKAFFLSATIEYHWSRILRHRKKGCKLLSSGTAPTSATMLRLNHRIMRHANLVMQQEKYYENTFVPPIRGNI